MRTIALEELLIPLIKGDFSKEETREVLLNMVDHKIKFHHKKKLDYFELTGENLHTSDDRVLELKLMREKLLNYLDQSEKSHFSIESNVKVTAV